MRKSFKICACVYPFGFFAQYSWRIKVANDRKGGLERSMVLLLWNLRRQLKGSIFHHSQNSKLTNGYIYVLHQIDSHPKHTAKKFPKKFIKVTYARNMKFFDPRSPARSGLYNYRRNFIFLPKIYLNQSLRRWCIMYNYRRDTRRGTSSLGRQFLKL